MFTLISLTTVGDDLMLNGIASFAFSGPLVLFLRLGFDDNPRLPFEEATGGHLVIIGHGFVIE